MLFLVLGCEPVEPDITTWTLRPTGEFWANEAGEAIPLPASLAGETALADVSRYGRVGVPTGRGDAGSFGVGNGIVFGLIGLDDPVNTLTNAIGPGYQADAGFFGDSAFVLDAPVTDAAVQRPRGTAIVRTVESADGVTLHTTSYASPGQSGIVRHLDIVATRSGTVRWAISRGEDELPEFEAGVVQTRGSRRTRLSCDVGELIDDAWVVTFQAGEQSVVCTQVFSEGDFIEVSPDLSGAIDAASEALAGSLELNVPDPKVADLYEGMLVTTWAQTTPSGLVSPMSRYTSGWLRDTEGPVRLWLRAGLHEQALTTLESLWLAQLASGGVQNSFGVDGDLDAVVPPENPEEWWAEAEFMEGREPVEAPSYPILLHGMAADWTGASWDEQRMAFLRACLDRQVFSGDYLPFSGDETFRYPMSGAVGDLPEALGWSLHSSLLWRAAAGVLGENPESAPLSGFWTGEFWAPIVAFGGVPLGQPYEDVALQTTWWPEMGLASEQLDSHLTATVSSLLQWDGVLLSRLYQSASPNLIYTGMVPGMWLHAAAVQHRPEESDAFNALDLVATPSGHFEELHASDHGAFALTHQADGLGADVTARYRPWEGGNSVSALLDYLIGAQPKATSRTLLLAPHLPPDWPSFGAKGIRVGEFSVDMQIVGFAEGLVVQLSGTAGLAVSVELHGQQDFTAVWADGQLTEATGAVVRVRAYEQLIGVY